ncbi:MAG: phage portal protein, partial [Actinomycetota bacterium]|nr:phage portal protein [Actinomycetota bacterium]
MFNNFRNWIERRKLRSEIETRELRLAAGLMDRYESLWDSPQPDPDSRDWIPMGDRSSLGSGEVIDWDQTRTKARNLFYHNPYGKGIVRTYVRSIVGPGFKIEPKCETEAGGRQVGELWEEWQKESGWDAKRREFVRRTIRDGETFLNWRMEPSFEDMDVLLPFDFSTAQLRFRMIEPSEIRRPNSGAWSNDPTATHGIVTAPDDTELVEGYLHTPDTNGPTTFIPWWNMLHHKLTVDAQTKRGLTVLLSVMERIRRYNKWQTYRLMKAEFMSLVFLIRKHHKSSPAERETFAEASRTGQQNLRGRNVTENKTLNTKMYAPGSMIDAGGKTDYEFITPNLHAGDAQADGRSILLSIATGVGLSEPMVTADASNANFASTLIAEAPAIAELRDHQAMFKPVFCDGIFMRWLEFEMFVSRRLPVGICEGCDITWPRLVFRDVLMTAKADQILNIMGVKSAETIATENDLDFEEEQDRLEKEQARA